MGAIRVNATVDPRDRERLSAQAEKILNLLRQRPHTALELAAHALNYRARVSEIRQAGYIITAERQPHGASLYRFGGYRDKAQLELVR